MTNIKQLLINAHINAFAAELLCESLLKHPQAQTLEFFFPVNRKDCPNWVGVNVRLEPVAVENEQDMQG